MNWSDYESVWKRQELPLGDAAEIASLRSSFETKHRRMAAALRVRDFGEAGAGLAVSGALGLVWWKTDAAGWPMGGAIALVLAVSVGFLRERFRSARLQVAADAPLLAKVAADIAQVRRQLRLYRWVWAWYLGPILAALLLVHGALCASAPPWDVRRDPLFTAGFVAFYVAMTLLAWCGVRRVVRRQLAPRLRELEKLQRELAALD